MKNIFFLILTFTLVACSHHSSSRKMKFEDRVNAQSAATLSQVEENLKELLNSHKELTEDQRTKISDRVHLFMKTQRSLRVREQKLLEIGLGDAIYASEASKKQWKKEVNSLYEQKAENIETTVNDIHVITQDPPVKKEFFQEFPLFMNEVR